MGERLGDRCLSAWATDLSATHLRTGQLSADEQQQALDAARELARLPIHVDDNPKTGMDHIRSSARLLKGKGRCDCIIIDYLQLCEMKSEQKNRNREQEVAEASRKAKLMAKELDVPVILLCQLNRDCETRADHRPALSDLRESGAIEQDADVVMLLYRPAFYGIPTERKRVSQRGAGSGDRGEASQRRDGRCVLRTQHQYDQNRGICAADGVDDEECEVATSYKLRATSCCVI